MKKELNKPADYEKRPRRETQAEEESNETSRLEKLPTKDVEGQVQKDEENKKPESAQARMLREKAERLAKMVRCLICKIVKSQNLIFNEQDVEVKEEGESEEEEGEATGFDHENDEDIEIKEEDMNGEVEEEEKGSDEVEEEEVVEDEDDEDKEDEGEMVDEYDVEDMDFKEEDEEVGAKVATLRKLHKEQAHIEEMKGKMAAIGSLILSDADAHVRSPFLLSPLPQANQ